MDIMNSSASLDELVPFRKPWLLIDSVSNWSANEFIVINKRFSSDDEFVRSHLHMWPHIVPGVLLIELVGQAGFLLGRLSGLDKPVHVLGRCKAHFYRPAVADRDLLVTVRIASVVRGVTVCQGHVEMDGDTICRVESMGAPLS